MLKFPKSKPIRSKALFMSYNKANCEVCQRPAVDRHHIVFKSQGGGDEHSNLIALCREHHNEAHGVNSREWREIFKDIKNK